MLYFSMWRNYQKWRNLSSESQTGFNIWILSIMQNFSYYPIHVYDKISLYICTAKQNHVKLLPCLAFRSRSTDACELCTRSILISGVIRYGWSPMTSPSASRRTFVVKFPGNWLFSDLERSLNSSASCNASDGACSCMIYNADLVAPFHFFLQTRSLLLGNKFYWEF